MYLLLNKVNENKNKLTKYVEDENKEYHIKMEKYNKDKRIGIINISKPKIDELLQYIPKSSSNDYKYLNDIVNILRPFYNLTLLLEKRNITLCMAVLNIKRVLYELNTSIYTKDFKEYADRIKESVNDRLRIIYSETRIPLMCCILDPRVKTFIKESLVGFTVDEFTDAKNALHSLQ